MSYADFLARKQHAEHRAGFEPTWMPESAFRFQSHLTEWAVRLGRAAMFADTGLGKTLMQLAWARNVTEHTGGRVLILAPLAVGEQTEQEGRRIGVVAAAVREPAGHHIEITNYERLHLFDPADYAGVVLDESSILKNFTGKIRTALIEAFQNTRFRLACTATPAPNDHTELGNHAEFLGVTTRTEMLARFFINDGATSNKWRLKGHAVRDFWTWVRTWACMVRHPRDTGFEQDGYDLPPLHHHYHITKPGAAEGDALIALPALTLNEQRKARRESLPERVDLLRDIVAAEPDESWLVWCDMNDESRGAAEALDAVEVFGTQKEEAKREGLIGFARGDHRRLVTKPSIAGHGMNWQHCARVAFLGVSHSFERSYQAIRRCWRFGQTRPVHVHMIVSHRERTVLENLQRKEADWRLAHDQANR